MKVQKAQFPQPRVHPTRQSADTNTRQVLRDIAALQTAQTACNPNCCDSSLLKLAAGETRTGPRTGIIAGVTDRRSRINRLRVVWCSDPDNGNQACSGLTPNQYPAKPKSTEWAKVPNNRPSTTSETRLRPTVRSSHFLPALPQSDHWPSKEPR